MILQSDFKLYYTKTKTETMKHTFYFLGLVILLMAGCKKDGTEKRCDKGFTGKNCDQEITPAKMQVTFIKSTALPPFDGSSNWDPLGGMPDVYFRIVEESTNTVVYVSGSGTNNNPLDELQVDLSNSNVLINSPTSKYIIEAWDYDDLDADDYMGGIIFTPYTKGEHFPATVKLSCTGCKTAWKIDFTYLF
jgi:hypothetical protein